MAILLLSVCMIMPVTTALKIESNTWCKVFYISDFFFLIDMIFTFFTTLPPKNEDKEVVDRKVIANTYLSGWFPIELLAIMPLDLLFSIAVG
jgi:hypothetical protein